MCIYQSRVYGVIQLLYDFKLLMIKREANFVALELAGKQSSAKARCVLVGGMLSHATSWFFLIVGIFLE